MARTRNLKPGFFTNEALADLPPLTRLAFQGLWLHADRAGRLEDRPRKLKAEILPYDDCDMEVLLTQLENAGFIQRYSADGTAYIALPTFDKHQHPHPKEPDSVIPEPCKATASTRLDNERTLPERLFLPSPNMPSANTPTPHTPTTDSVCAPWDDFSERGESPPTEPLVKAIANTCKQDVDRVGERVLLRLSRCAEDLCRLEPDMSRQAIALLVDDFGPWHEQGNTRNPVPAPEWIPDKWGAFKAWKLEGSIDPIESLRKKYAGPEYQPGGRLCPPLGMTQREWDRVWLEKQGATDGETAGSHNEIHH